MKTKMDEKKIMKKLDFFTEEYELGKLPFNPIKLDFSDSVTVDTAHTEISNKLQDKKGLGKAEADEQAGKILSAAKGKQKGAEKQEKQSNLLVDKNISNLEKRELARLGLLLSQEQEEQEKHIQLEYSEKSKAEYAKGGQGLNERLKPHNAWKQQHLQQLRTKYDKKTTEIQKAFRGM